MLAGVITAGGSARGPRRPLVLCGDPGVGKSALLDFAASSTDMRVVRGTGIEFESELPFAAVHQLLGSLSVDTVPPASATPCWARSAWAPRSPRTAS